MQSLLNYMYSYFENLKNAEKEMCTEFSKRAEEATERYYKAIKLPRKLKKKVRKECILDYHLYTKLAKPTYFNF